MHMNDSQNQDFSAGNDDQSLEAQNIFEMLGADAGSDELKNSFLDELQETVWDDFIENDVELLLNEQQREKYKALDQAFKAAVEEDAKDDAQDKVVEFLEESIENFEDVMLEKALDLKADLFVERILSMREENKDNQEMLNQLAEVEKLISKEHWLDATNLLNSLA